MCGIAGCFNPRTPPDAALLQTLCGTMRQRGPDAHDIHLDDALGLAHTRLSVIDLDGGAQPMHGGDGRYTLVFNGEIFNFRELRAELEQAGGVFRTKSDTEVLLKLLIREGENCLSRLNGFFAFAFYDATKKTLLLARDYHGVKPLYYFHLPTGEFAFASRFATLALCPGCPTSISLPALADYLAFQYIPAPATIREGVKKLLPGTAVEFQLETGSVREIEWGAQIEIKPETISYEDACERVRNLLSGAVERRLIADVPLGVFLSGGLDSAVITALAARHSTAPLECFSIGFDDPRYDESADCKATAAHLAKLAPHGLHHHIKIVQPEDFGLLPKLVAEFGEPYADASMLPTYFLAAFAREHVTVALSGDGADELFGGYERYRAMHMIQNLRTFTPGFLWSAAAACLPDSGERTKAGRLKRFLRLGAVSGTGARYDALMSHFAADAIGTIAPDLRPYLNAKRTLPEAASLMASLMEDDLRRYLPGDVLTKVDVCSMAASLEVRNPFLDPEVSKFARALPVSFKIQGDRRKRILGDAFTKELPSGLAARRKRGFGVPVAAWFRTVWRDRLREALLDELPKQWDMFDRAAVERLIEEHQNGGRDRSYLLFSLLMLSFQRKKPYFFLF
ncbi:MAG: asparagine synthase (glutamine-hydrolyzing) [Lentisphaeria bacterium]|nr:asparagine synthase (glutamine-hydrolyzing) [Lentisphaeria bacterium]